MIKFTELDKTDKECLMTLENFKKNVSCGAITNYDGFGYYATSTKVSDMYTDMYDIKHDIQPEWVTHVCWYYNCSIFLQKNIEIFEKIFS